MAKAMRFTYGGKEWDKVWRMRFCDIAPPLNGGIFRKLGSPSVDLLFYFMTFRGRHLHIFPVTAPPPCDL